MAFANTSWLWKSSEDIGHEAAHCRMPQSPITDPSAAIAESREKWFASLSDEERAPFDVDDESEAARDRVEASQAAAEGFEDEMPF